jgi:Ubiquitin family
MQLWSVQHSMLQRMLRLRQVPCLFIQPQGPNRVPCHGGDVADTRCCRCAGFGVAKAEPAEQQAPAQAAPGNGAGPSNAALDIRNAAPRKRSRSEVAPPAATSPISIDIKTMTGKTLYVRKRDGLRRSDTVAKLKAWIQDQDSTPPEQQMLVHMGRLLQRDNAERTLGECKVQDGSTLHLVVQLSGC